MQLILASGSPRRKELLGLFGIPFTIRAADIDETMDAAKAPFDEVARVSRLKALAAPREIIKGKVLDNNIEYDARIAAEELAKATRSEVVQVIGTKFVLYRESHSKPKLNESKK